MTAKSSESETLAVLCLWGFDRENSKTKEARFDNVPGFFEFRGFTRRLTDAEPARGEDYSTSYSFCRVESASVIWPSFRPLSRTISALA